MAKVPRATPKPKVKRKRGRPPSSKYYAGLRFGMLVLKQKVRTPANAAGGQRWLIECDCGQRLTKPIFYLVRPSSPLRSCGCDIRARVNPYPREKGIWQMMNRRCYYPDHKYYKYYGGANPPVTVCEEWRERRTPEGKLDSSGFDAFIKYMGPAPTKKHTLDRINPYKGYEPGNLRWATMKQQANNQRRHHEPPPATSPTETPVSEEE